jgi:hypothetical protein
MGIPLKKVKEAIFVKLFFNNQLRHSELSVFRTGGESWFSRLIPGLYILLINQHMMYGDIRFKILFFVPLFSYLQTFPNKSMLVMTLCR